MKLCNNSSPKQIDQIFNMALDFHRKKDLKNAAKYYNQVAAIDPFYHSLHYHMGIVQWGMGRIDDAVNCYIAAICSDTNDAKSFFELGNLYFDQGKAILSILCFLRAIQIKPDFSAAHINMSMLLDRIEDRQLLIAAYKKMIEQNEHVFEMGGALAYSSRGIKCV
ncbi:MAG: tetratricopeptide repeat protein [Desulfobacula sp.]|nr:tetratricopeptide repeat protein [Desulfobacula sp.]